MEKVIALTVTYNRADKLKKVIESLLNQTYKLEKIIIVDNNSDENNKQKILELSKQSNKIELIQLKKNTGGAGGFYTGVKHINERLKYNWIWIMDDDAYPEVNCLENLLNEKNKLELKNVGFLAPLIYGIDFKKYQNYHHKIINKKNLKETDAFKNENIPNYKLIDANAFVGPLISKEAVLKVGYPDKDLFIYGDDTEYTYRIRQYFEGYFIKKAIINHQDPIFGSKGGIWKIYYIKRNKILFYKKYSKELKFLIFKEKFLTLIQSLKMLLDLEISLNQKIKKIKYLYKGLNDGVKGIKGIIVKP